MEKAHLYGFEQIFQKAKDAHQMVENELKVYRALLENAKKYPRIHISELQSQISLDSKKCVSIVKNLISTKRIPAKYDQKSQGIEFFPEFQEEIDRLTHDFEYWESNFKDKEKKK